MMRLLLILALLLPLSSHAEDRLGRLFLTPAERGHLDQLRRTSKPPEKAGPVETSAEHLSEASSPPPDAVTIQGYVKRSDGKGTVWVNRQPVQEQTSAHEISIGKLGAKDNRVEVRLPGNGKAVSLKAGQTYDTASGMIVDNPGQLPEMQAVPLPPQEKPAKPTPVPEAPQKP